MLSYIKLTRPRQFIKNGFVLLPLFFGHRLHDSHSVTEAMSAFFIFCLLAAGVYTANDILDRDEDRLHPYKKNRPIASGSIPVSKAAFFMAALIICASALSIGLMPAEFSIILLSYILINAAYSLFLKHYAIIDILCVASGFVLRVFAGSIAIDTEVSSWVVIMTFLLALFLSLAKRRDDFIVKINGYDFRKSLEGYNLKFISLSLIALAPAIIVCYIMYAVSPEIVKIHGSNYLYMTSIWVITGLLRFLQMIFVHNRKGSPTSLLINDYILQFIITAWLAHLYILLYYNQ